MHSPFYRTGISSRTVVSSVVLLLLVGCSSVPEKGPEGAHHGAIIVAGEEFSVAAPVVTFRHPEGFNAYLERCAFAPDQVLPSRPAQGCNVPKRYGSRSTKGMPESLATEIAKNGWSLEAIRERVTQFVLHFDVCVTSTQCFKTLQDVRGLSVHFMLDVDGTIYQSLDLVERARHAGTANDVSIGIEIAHIGGYPWNETDWKQYYQLRPDGRYDLVIPEKLHPPKGGPFRTSRSGLFEGIINGGRYVMADYTEEQYRSLEALVATLTTVFPKLRKDCPRDASGNVRDGELTPEELAAFSGILGHHHVTKAKNDPGPAMDWDRILAR